MHIGIGSFLALIGLIVAVILLSVILYCYKKYPHRNEELLPGPEGGGGTLPPVVALTCTVVRNAYDYQTTDVKQETRRSGSELSVHHYQYIFVHLLFEEKSYVIANYPCTYIIIFMHTHGLSAHQILSFLSHLYFRSTQT